MGDWTPEQWAYFFGAVGLMAGGLTTGIVKIIEAVRSVGTKVDQTASKVDRLEIKVDGRLTQLLQRTQDASKAEGVEVGRGQMAAVTVPPVANPVEPSQVQDDGTMVIGVPNNPTPPVLLVPVEEQAPGDEEKEKKG